MDLVKLEQENKLSQLHDDIVNSIINGIIELDEKGNQIHRLITTGDDLVEVFGITRNQADLILTDPNLLTKLNTRTQANAVIAFHSKAIRRLNKIVDSDDNKEALSGIKLLGEITGNLKNKVNVNVNNMNLSLEDRIKKDELNKEKTVEDNIIELKNLINIEENIQCIDLTIE